MEENKNIPQDGVNKDTSEDGGILSVNKDEKWKLKDYFMASLVFIFLTLVSYGLYAHYTDTEEEQKNWRLVNAELKLQGNKCEILRVIDINKSYEPRKTELSIQYYGSKEIRKVELPIEVEIPETDKIFLGEDSYIPILDDIVSENPKKKGAFVKVCFNTRGYIDTVEKYTLMEGK